MSEGGVNIRLLQQALKNTSDEVSRLRHRMDQSTSVDETAKLPHVPRMSEERVSRIEGMVDVLKLFPSFLLAALALAFTVMVALVGYVATQVASVERRVENINGRLSEEFRAMRTDMNAQTSAIANAITATRQAPPQILLLPAPDTPPKPPQ